MTQSNHHQNNQSLRRPLWAILRLLLIWAIEAATILLTVWIIPEISLSADSPGGMIGAALLTGLMIAALNVIIRPLLIMVTLPINILSLGLFPLLTNAVIFILADYLLPFFEVKNILYALLGSLLLITLNLLVTGVLNLNRRYSFFDGSIQWLTSLARKKGISGQSARGLVILEIDGLSRPALQRALDQGLLPAVKDLINRGHHKVAAYDCGVPSQSSSSQAAIMYGDNWDIPAFRWYDKDLARLISSDDYSQMAMINQRYSRSQGLLRSGSSINNFFSGGATNTVFTLSGLDGNLANLRVHNFWYLNLVFLNPYAPLQTAFQTSLDVVSEFIKGLKQLFPHRGPRGNPWHSAYPLTRALANILLRDISTHMVVSDIILGVPAIYTTYIGYDKVAHKAGPQSREALGILRGIDAQIDYILDIVRRKAPREYDIVLLSDHGQSGGLSFKQRYGYSLTRYIHRLLKAGKRPETRPARHSDPLEAAIRTAAAEIRSGWMSKAGISPAHPAFPGPDPLQKGGGLTRSDVVVCVGGNMANVYFKLHPGKVCLDEIEKACPNFLLSLIAHPGIGLVVGYQDPGTPLVWSRVGRRNLKTGEITGEDPLQPYGDPLLRAGQLFRLALFPHSGDLIINSAVMANSEVAPFEEFLGSHGGLGGDQNAAFIIYPDDMDLPPTATISSLFNLLNARR